MQNKPNLPDTQINASHFKTKNYEQNTMEAEPAKQSQNKPNQTQFMVSLSNQQSQFRYFKSTIADRNNYLCCRGGIFDIYSGCRNSD
jgi:hypothetical protein